MISRRCMKLKMPGSWNWLFPELKAMTHLLLNYTKMLELPVSPKPVSAKANTTFWGAAFLLFGCVSFLGFLYAAIFSKLLPPSDIWFLSAIRSDWCYCLLVPVTPAVVVVAVYFHWLSMKLFKHA